MCSKLKILLTSCWVCNGWSEPVMGSTMPNNSMTMNSTHYKIVSFKIQPRKYKWVTFCHEVKIFPSIFIQCHLFTFEPISPTTRPTLQGKPVNQSPISNRTNLLPVSQSFIIFIIAAGCCLWIIYFWNNRLQVVRPCYKLKWMHQHWHSIDLAGRLNCIFERHHVNRSLKSQSVI